MVCSFPALCCPVGSEEKWTLGVRSSTKRENVAEQVKPHRDWQTRAVVKA